MSEEKTYVFGQDNANSMWPLALLGNNGFGNGGWESMWMIIVVFLMYGMWGGNGFGFGNNGGGIASLANDSATRDLILQGINGNQNAISSLASTLNTDFATIADRIGQVNTMLCQVGNQIGMSGMQVINAVQAGDSALAAQFAQCCCENKLLTTTQGYENRIAISEQTNTLAGKIDAQTTLINDKFCQLEMREMQNKLDALREDRTSLRNQLSQEHQTGAIQAYVSSLVNPIAAEVTAIKAAQPPTVAVPYPQLAAVPASVGFAYGLSNLANNGYGFLGYNNNNGSIWA